MNWIFLTILATFIGSISSILDRYILKHENHHPAILTSIWGLVSCLTFLTPALYTQQVTWNWTLGLGGMLIGFLYIVGMYFYYASVNQAEVDRIIPILTLNPVLVLILATIFFQEMHTLVQNIGIIIIIIGIIVVSLHDHRNRRALPLTAILLISTASVSFAVKNIITKALSFNPAYTPLNLVFWIGCGMALSLFILLIKQKGNLLKLPNQKFFHIFLTAFFSAIASLLFTFAIIIGDVSLASFLSKLDILFVFILVESIDFFNPNILKEPFQWNSFFQKLSAVLLILIGSLFLI